MAALTHQKCFNHALREAAGQCLSCHHCFCRECLVEHHGRLTCAACLRAAALAPPTRRPWGGRLLGLLRFSFGLLLSWTVFYLFGKCLLLLPSSFHEGSLWREAGSTFGW